MRPIVKYDDISGPAPPPAQSLPTNFGQQPPYKKRKRTNQKPPNHQQMQHWDDPGNPDQYMPYAEDAAASRSSAPARVEEAEEDEESRELTHDEIWDDSALIDAWNAASEEYEAYHGPDKGWKKEPTHKSPLWYNVPPSPSSLKKSQAAATPSSAPGPSTGPAETPDDSRPLNFDTFVPNHDASLAVSAPPYPAGGLPDYSGSHLAAESEVMVSQDEAFTRAMGAMYWAGYYTAVYHRQNQNEVTEADEEGQEEAEEVEDLVSTQR
ncbi:hypothetical protein HWV62_38506 [Athelia sp. TMB]|nr:hypothetical protein HWV62_38506 [Athelia sp. TMB]